MLTPAQLETAGLGCKWDVGYIHVPKRLPSATPPLNAWTRVTGAPRVLGGNLLYGSCVETACYNAVVNAEAKLGNMISVTDNVVLGTYSAVTGFRQGEPGTDNGTNPLSMWSWWRDNTILGWTLAEAHPIMPNDEESMRKGMEEFPAVALVLALAREQQNQRVFMPDGQPGSWGYHCVAVDGFDGSYTWGTSWGFAQALDRSFLADAQRAPAAWALELKRKT